MKVRRDGERKGKPMGNNTRVLHGARPQALEGSTPSPSAALTKECARSQAGRRLSSKQSKAGSTPAGHSDRCDVRLPARSPGSQPGQAGSTPARRTDCWRGTQTGKATRFRNGCLWVRLPPALLSDDLVARLAECPALNREVVGSTPTGVTVRGRNGRVVQREDGRLAPGR